MTTPPTPAAPAHSAILVVEDDAAVRKIVVETLAGEGWRVFVAADGQQAIARAVAPPPSLVVLDVTLPVVDGYGVAAALRAAHGPDLPILVVSADGQVAAKARRVGAFAYLRKPFDLDELVAIVRRGLRRPLEDPEATV